MIFPATEHSAPSNDSLDPTYESPNSPSFFKVALNSSGSDAGYYSVRSNAPGDTLISDPLLYLPPPQLAIVIDPIPHGSYEPPSYIHSQNAIQENTHMYPYLGLEPGLVRCPHCRFLGVSKIKHPGRGGCCCIDQESCGCLKCLTFCGTFFCAIFPMPIHVISAVFLGTSCVLFAPTRDLCPANRSIAHCCRRCDKVITEILE